MNNWRYDECEVMFYHEDMPTSCSNVVDALNAAEARVDELENQAAELKPYRDGYDPNEFLPEEGVNIIVATDGWLQLICQRRGECWYNSNCGNKLPAESIKRWWMIPGYYPEGMQIIIVMHEKENENEHTEQ